MMTIGKTRHPATTEPRGVLRAMIPGEISHQRQAPPAALARFVEHFWRVRWNFEGLPPKVVETLPHPNVHIVIEPGTSQVFGVHTGRWTRALEGRSTAFGIKFRPGAFRPLLRDAVSSLRDASLPIEAIFGSEAHELDAIADCRDDSKGDARAIELAAKFLLARVPSLDQSALLAGRMVDSVVDNREMHNAAALAKKFEMGLRAVQRLFHEYVGVGPKWVINRYRVHEAIARVQAGNAVSWAALAQDLGYFDQAHFITEFRKLVGESPAGYAARWNPR